jgi:hypothetical protein
VVDHDVVDTKHANGEDLLHPMYGYAVGKDIAVEELTWTHRFAFG